MSEWKNNVEKIKEEILDFLSNWAFLQRTSSPSPSVMNQFIFDLNLTQSEIRERSNLSIAKVYKELNKLIDMRLVKKQRISHSNEVFYSMERIDIALIEFMAKNSKKLIKWTPKFEEIHGILQKNKAYFRDLNGFNEILRWTKFFLRILKFYKLSYQTLLDKKFELEQKKAEKNNKI